MSHPEVISLNRCSTVSGLQGEVMKMECEGERCVEVVVVAAEVLIFKQGMMKG